jgi:hypothetical protein
MGEKIRQHIRSDGWGMAATFVAPSDTAYPAAGRSAGAPGLLRRAGLVLGLALVALLAGLGGSAHAAVAALERVTELSASDSTANKSVTTDPCPAGKQVTGAGADILNGFGQVVLRQVRPDPALTSVTVQALEDQNGQTANWSVEAYAICATPPAGLERVSATSASDSSNKGVTVACPVGKRLLGTGGELAGGGGQVALNDIIPNAALTGVTVRGMEDGDGTTANWSVTAYAICSTPVAGRERVVTTSPTDSSSKGVSVPCPPDKEVTGVGGEIGGGGGEVVLDALFPNAPSIAGANAFEDENGTASNWFVRAFAICAASSQRVVTKTPSDSEDKAEVAECPAFKQLTGGGGDITGGSGQVSLTEIFPADVALTGFLAAGEEDGNDFAGDWFLRIYGICATPLPGLELVSFSNPSPDSPTIGSVGGDLCTGGKRVVGVGGEISGGDGQVVLARVNTVATLTSVFLTGREDEDGYADNWSRTVYAICATPPPGLELVTAESDPDSDPASVTARCPAGKNLLGVGAEIVGLAIADGGQVVLDDVRPNALLTSVTVTGLEDETGFAKDWFLRADAICANA